MTANFASGTIWTGDNLRIMRGMNDACVDLIYLDPPFNSNRHYEAPIGSKAAGAAFKDAWTLDDVDVYEHGELADRNPVAHAVIEATRQVHGKSMQSYLIFMAMRLLEMHRILKPTGSVYLHCDPTASHYLKLMMDAIFRNQNFRNEIIWCYSRLSAPRQRQLSRVHDTLLWYSAGGEWTFNPNDIRQPYASGSLARKGYAANASKVAAGAVELNEYGKFPESWIYIPPLKGNSKEYAGYPTQKPIALLERIIKASSNPGDLVFDPFCGCATTLVAADRLQRRWAGIDLSPLAIKLVNERISADRPRSADGNPWSLFTGAIALDTPPRHTDLGTLPNYRTHRYRLYGEQEGICAGRDTHFPFRVMEVDHILPWFKGGTDHPDNLQRLCSSCNRSKDGQTMAEWRSAT